MEVGVVIFLLLFVFAWYYSDKFFFNETISNKLVNVMRFFFHQPGENIWRMSFSSSKCCQAFSSFSIMSTVHWGSTVCEHMMSAHV